MTSVPTQTNLSSQSALSAPQGQTQAAAASLAAPGRFSYASATKKNVTPHASESSNMASAVGIPPAQHGHSDSLNGRNITTPAIPSVGSSAGVNGNSMEHNRKPSMTVTPAGATVNGGAVGGPQNKTTGIQFGSVNATGSAMGTPAAPANHASNFSATLNPRTDSPHNSPSPIPQPAAPSGGRPPSTIQAQGIGGLSFGQTGPELGDPNMAMRQMPQMDHMRRGSAQSVHSDMGSGNPTRGGYNNYPGAARGRGGYSGQYNQQAPYSPQTANFRPQPRGNYSGYQQGGRGQPGPYPNSPSMTPRTPAYANANPGTPQMGPLHLVPGMPYQGYQQMGPQVNRHFSSSQLIPPRGKAAGGRTRGGPPRGRRDGTYDTGRGGQKPGFAGIRRDPALDSSRFEPKPHAPFSLVPTDLSPASGNFEHILTNGPQNFLQYRPDPSIDYMTQQQYAMNQQNQYPGYGPPQSPRPPFTPNPQAQYMQPSYSNQGHQPPSMSRQSSQMSMPERPGSTVGHAPTPSMTPATAQSHTASRAPSVAAAPKMDFQVPRKSKAIAIVNPATKDVVKVEKPVASPATQAPPKTATPPVPTPSPKIVDPSHARTDSVTVKTSEERQKAMQEAVARKIAEDKAKAQPEQVEKEVPKEEVLKEEAPAIEESKNKEPEVEAPEEEVPVAEVKVPENTQAEQTKEPKVIEPVAAEVKTPEPAEEVKEEAPAPAPAPPAEDEFDIDAFEAEMAAKEAEEARKEEEYAKKKAAQKEAQRKKEEEEEAMYEANMKKAEAEAEEREAKKEAERKAAEEKRDAEEPASDEDSIAAKMDRLRVEDPPTPTSQDSPAIQTPEISGTQTPISDISMPPPARGMPPGKRGKANELTLNTTKAVEPPEPSATLKSLKSARKLDDLTKIEYPSNIASPNPALNANAPADRKFKYNKEFLLQFQQVFKEKPSLDWDAKIKEALGDGGDSTASARGGSARTPSGMGPRTQSTRGTVGNAFPAMGAFGSGGARNTPVGPGTTSEQRFAMANAGGVASSRAPVATNPFAMGRPPGMGMATPMGRNPSNNPMGMIPQQSPRGGPSGRGASRNESKRKNPRQAAQENSSMPLTAGMDLNPIQVSSSGWKPRSIVQANTGPALGGDGLMAPDVVQRKVKSNLNKMTPEKFEKIADQVLEIAAQSKDESDGRTLRQVIQLTFEKATDEAHWAPMYAMFCQRMLQSMNNDIKDENIKDKAGNVVTGGNLFRKYLLNRCQEEFEKGWKLNLPDKPEGVTEEAAMLSDEYYIAAAAKRRGLGLVRFIGELFKLGMLTERIMHECVKKLLDYEGMPDEAEVESLTSLLRTVGAVLDDPGSKAQPRMDAYFERITIIMNMPELPSRLRFMLLDIIDLRKSKWRSAQNNAGPKTITEIHAEAEANQRQAEAQRLVQQANRGGGRMPSGRGDARFQYGQMPPPDNSNRVNTSDLRGLSGRSTRNASNTTGGPGGAFGPGSLLAGRQGSGRRGLATGLSSNSSRTGTPPTQKEEKKDEASTNAFSALAALENAEGPASPPSAHNSPPTTKSQPSAQEGSSGPAAE